MAKKIAQFALPHTTAYTLVDSYHTGSLLDGGGTSCQNCGKTITNVGVVQNEAGEKFSVGMDCASTLSGISDYAVYEHSHGFALVKNLSAGIRKDEKKYGADYYLEVSELLDGDFRIEARRKRELLGKPSSEMVFRRYFKADEFTKFIQPGCPAIKGLPVTPPPTIHGTEDTAIKAGDKVTYNGVQVTVWETRPNLDNPESRYKQVLNLLRVPGLVLVDDALLVA